MVTFSQSVTVSRLVPCVQSRVRWGQPVAGRAGHAGFKQEAGSSLPLRAVQPVVLGAGAAALPACWREAHGGAWDHHSMSVTCAWLWQCFPSELWDVYAPR